MRDERRGEVRHHPEGGVMRVARLLAPLLVVLVLVAPVSAYAVEVTPFAITSFTNEATGPTRIVPRSGGFHGFVENEFYEFLNEPSGFTQAGGHPWGLTTAIEFASEQVERHNIEHPVFPTRDPKDIIVGLPPGLVGNPMAVPRCPLSVALSTVRCPPSTQVGVFRFRWFGGNDALGPIVDVVPEAGQSAEFAFETSAGVKTVLTGHLVRIAHGVSGCVLPRGCYGLTVASNGIPTVSLVRVETTFWGVPADPSHDLMRGLECSIKLPEAERIGSHAMRCDPRSGGQRSGERPVPFLTLSSDCGAGSETATVRADSWEEPGSVGPNGQYSEQYRTAEASMPGVTGCDLLAFGPSIEVQPETLLADSPVGLGVNLRVPQPDSPQALGTPHLRDAVVTLPEGMSVSPGVVDGVQACNESGPEGIDFTGPESEEVGLNGELQLAPGHCPGASTVGEAEAVTPLLPEPVKGHVYLARPGCGGAGQAACTEHDALDGNLYKLYLELGGEGPLANTGVHIKVPGFTEANPATGQLTTKFLENPQVPFSELKIRLNGGPRAPIDNPSACGQALTTTNLTPWSEPGETPQGLQVAGTPDASPSSFFDVQACASPPGLAPGFLGGTVTPQAGQFTAFTLNFSRQDREQYLSGIQVHTPPGLVGMLSSVPLCEEPQARLGTCPGSSKIGSTRVASGAGSHPFEISGDVFLTKGYKGAPFGLSIVTHAVAGPFNLGLVVVRSRIDVDPVTSQLTVTSDPLPQIVFGVPLRLKRVTVNIDRPGFMLNPTNCGAPGQPGSQQVSANVSGSQNAVASVASQFAVGGCQSLAFNPQFAVSTSGRTSKQNGASLDTKLTYPPFHAGSEANIAYVKVELPKQLPSRLTTLQKACVAATFEANPAMCPAQSVIGVVRAQTPVLPVALEGPAFFVSHGGEAFPSLVVVLQGDGVRVDLTGSTFISKAGVTSTTFKTVPDVPVSTFELYLPQGPYSALAANVNLCSLTTTKTVKHAVTRRVHGRTIHTTLTTHVKTPASLNMPTELIAQNGAVLKQNTIVQVTGCNAGTAKTSRHPTKASHARARAGRRAAR
jgi:hypothetical protein